MTIQDKSNWYEASNFIGLVEERFTNSNRLVESGIAMADPTLQMRLNPTDPSQGGYITTMPIGIHYNVEDTVQGSSSNDLVGTSRDSFLQKVALHPRVFAYQERRLKTWEAGVDPLGAAVSQAFTNYRSNVEGMMISTLKGIEAGFAAGDDSDLVISTASTAISFNVIADAQADFGDLQMQEDKILICSTKTYFDLLKADGAAASAGAGLPSGVMGFDNYQGLRVIVDDRVPANTSYLAVNGFFKLASMFSSEMWRNPAARAGEGNDQMYNRHWTYLCPTGFSYEGASTPANSVLEAAASWEGVYSTKRLVGLRVIKHS